MQIEFNYQGEDCRLDLLVLNALSAEPDYSHVTRSQVKRWIDTKLVQVNSKIAAKAGLVVKNGDFVKIAAEANAPEEILPYDFPLEILFEDEDLLVINKSSGISMHPGAGNHSETLVNAVFAYLDCKIKPEIVHRLDKDTTGIVVVAKNERAKFLLNQQFAERSTKRTYKALVTVTPRGKRAVQSQDSGSITTQIGRHPTKRTSMAVVAEGGRTAITHWKVSEMLSHAALLDVQLETGRTHQIRVHMAHLGSPIIGDLEYGKPELLPTNLRVKAQVFGRQALHAFRLGFTHPTNGKRLEFEVGLPEDFSKLIEDFRHGSV